MLRARGSPVSDGGRGLKLVQVPCAAALAVGSPVSDGGRGLKPSSPTHSTCAAPGFARQRWRAWIETPSHLQTGEDLPGFARQRWRAWIETTGDRHESFCLGGSPVSDGGRGLKQLRGGVAHDVLRVRPSAMAGVD